MNWFRKILRMRQQPPRKKRSTIADVARAAGVSKSTVSNYLNNRNDLFSGDTAARIKAAISSLRYIADPCARGIKNQEGGKSLGILLRKRIDQAISNIYFHQVLPGICDAMDDYGYRTLVIPETHAPQRDITYMRELAKGLLAGFFIFNIEGENDPYVEAFRLDGVKYVCVGYNPSVDNFIASRHDLGVESAVRHLVREHGCRRIAMLTESGAKSADIDKLKGYHAALAAHGIPANPALAATLDGGRETLARELRRILRPPNRGKATEALLVPHSELKATLSVLDDLRLKVPKDLRLVLFDPPSAEPDGSFAYIQVRTAMIGRAAADKMFKLLKGHPDGPGGVFLDVDFHPGLSCGCR